MSYGPADVLYIDCERGRLHGNPPKPKYLVCIDRPKLLFFFINSEPFRKLMHTQVSITRTDLPCLTNDVSFIDTRSIVVFRYTEIEPQIKAKPGRVKGHLPDELIDRVRDTALSHGLLYGWQEDILRANFI